jgi:hypothetical protein
VKEQIAETVNRRRESTCVSAVTVVAISRIMKGSRVGILVGDPVGGEVGSPVGGPVDGEVGVPVDGPVGDEVGTPRGLLESLPRVCTSWLRAHANNDTLCGGAGVVGTQQ